MADTIHVNNLSADSINTDEMYAGNIVVTGAAHLPGDSMEYQRTVRISTPFLHKQHYQIITMC